MSEARVRISRLLRAEFAQEVAAGFPRLGRIPSTQVSRFLDYFAGLNLPAQEALLDALVHFNSVAFIPELAGTDIAERRQHPVFGPLMESMASHGLGGGYRYTPVKLLAGIARDTAIGGLEGWFKQMGFSGLALQPREDLLPNPAALKPVAPVRLRKLIDTAFTRLFAPEKKKVASDHTRYIGAYNSCDLKVDILLPRPLSPKQMGYFAIIKPAADFTWSHGSYEHLWSIPGNWDYLTEENAPRAIEHLAELVIYLVGLATRVGRLKSS